MVGTALHSQAMTKKPQFLKITPEELKQHYSEKVLNAETYVLYIIRTKLAVGWKWRLDVKSFCAEWGIVERTFYWALSRLKAKKLVDWRNGSNTIVVSWGKNEDLEANTHSGDLTNSQNPVSVTPPQDVASAVQDVAEVVQYFASAVQDVAEETAETIELTPSQPSTDSLQIGSDSHTDSAPADAAPLPHPESVCVEEDLEQEEQQELPVEVIHEFSSCVDLPKESELEKPKDPNLGQSSAAPCNKTSQSNKTSQTSQKSQKINWNWVPPGPWQTEEGKLDDAFLTAVAQKWVGTYGGDLHQKKTNALKHFRNEPTNLPIEWEWYQNTVLHRAANILVRQQNGMDTEADLQKIAQHARAMSLLPEQMRATESKSLTSIVEQVADYTLPAIQNQLLALGLEENNQPVALEQVQEKKPPQNIAKSVVVPEFHRMPKDEHSNLLQQFLSLGAVEFLSRCPWHRNWLNFAISIGSRFIPDLSPETIKKMREVVNAI